MRFLYWTISWLLLGPSAGLSLEKENISVGFSETATSAVKLTTTDVALPTEISVVADKALLERTAPDILAESKKRMQGEKEERVSVIKRTELGTVLESVYKRHQAYLSMDRYERVTKAPSGENRGQLQIELSHDIEPTIRVIDKPLVLGGDGFGTAGFEADDHRLHFTFNSHIKVPPIQLVEKQDAGYFDPDFEKAQSKKFLIFHRSSSNFGRHANFLEEFKLEQPLEQKMIYTKVEAIPSSWVFFDAHVKDFQNKATSLRLLPATKPLDLIYDNPAILQHDYQTLNSGGS